LLGAASRVLPLADIGRCLADALKARPRSA
jgi:hypothetical protein